MESLPTGGAVVPLTPVLGEPPASSLPCCLLLLLPCGWHPPPMYWCSSVSSPAANQTSEEACSKANLTTTTTKKENGRQNFCLDLLLRKMNVKLLPLLILFLPGKPFLLNVYQKCYACCGSLITSLWFAALVCFQVFVEIQGCTCKNGKEMLLSLIVKHRLGRVTSVPSEEITIELFFTS